MPEKDVVENERHADVLHAVIWAMAQQAKATYFEDTDGMDLVAKQAADSIVKLFEGES